MSKISIIISAVGLVMMVVLAACNAGPTQAPPAATSLPAGQPALDGATLLDTRCSTCHSADKAKKAKKTSEQWDQTVTRMVGKGAKLTETEKAVLLDYLAKTYGP